MQVSRLPVSPRRSSSWIAVAAALTVVAVTGIWLLTTGEPNGDPQTVLDVPFEQDDYVLITRFENLTDNPLFDDGTLEYALELALSDSRYLHVAPPERVEDALRLMKRPLDTVVDRTIGREVALRDGGIQVVLAGAIETAGSGSGYVLRTLLVNPQDGRVLDSVREDAPDEAGVTSAPSTGEPCARATRGGPRPHRRERTASRKGHHTLAPRFAAL